MITMQALVRWAQPGDTPREYVPVLGGKHLRGMIATTGEMC